MSEDNDMNEARDLVTQIYSLSAKLQELGMCSTFICDMTSSMAHSVHGPPHIVLGLIEMAKSRMIHMSLQESTEDFLEEDEDGGDADEQSW